MQPADFCRPLEDAEVGHMRVVERTVTLCGWRIATSRDLCGRSRK